MWRQMATDTVVKVAGVLTAYFHGKLPRITAPALALWQPGRSNDMAPNTRK